jgi:hypothetical protein
MHGRPAKNATVSIAAAVALRATERAILCRVPTASGAFECWVPLSQIAEDSEVREAGDFGTLSITTWWFKVSRTDQQFRANEKSKPARSSTRQNIRGFKKEDFDFSEEDRPGSPEVDDPISDDDVPF